MIDEDVVERISAAANLTAKDTVLEIGPGLGVLTQALLDKAGQVLAVELDRQALKYLQANFAGQLQTKKLQLVEGDALRINYAELGLADFNFKITANLPYSITSHFFKNFLELGPKPKEIIVMIQKEVAERLLAQPGEMNLLALSVQLFSQPEILFTVPSASFWPEPSIDSAVVKLAVRRELPNVDIKSLFRLAKIGFSAKRKQLHNNLASGLKIKNDEVKTVFAGFGWREDIRAQDLSLADWIKLTNKMFL